MPADATPDPPGSRSAAPSAGPAPAEGEGRGAAPAAAPSSALNAATPPAVAIGVPHLRRLRAVWHSAGWPYQDALEVDLLAAGLLHRHCDAQGRDTVRLSDAGIARLQLSLGANRAARDAHEQLVARVAREMQRAGRVVWRGLSLRARVGGDALPPPAADATPAPPADDGRWAIAMPDVYSIRNTTVEDWVEPVAHEIKVRRADLLADLRKPAKGEAYRWLSSASWYVLREGIAEPGEIPEAYGVLIAAADGSLQVARPAPRRPFRLPFMLWMALARAAPEPADDDAQPGLGAADGPDASAGGD